MKVLTTLHNFDTRQKDGTTPAQRIYRQEFPDLFETVIASGYSKLKGLFGIQNRKQNYKVLEQLLEHGEVLSEFTLQFSFERAFTQNDIEICGS